MCGRGRHGWAAESPPYGESAVSVVSMEPPCQVTRSGARDGRAQWRQGSVAVSRKVNATAGYCRDTRKARKVLPAPVPASWSLVRLRRRARDLPDQTRWTRAGGRKQPSHKTSRETRKTTKCLSISQESRLLGNKKLRDAKMRGSCESAKIRIRNRRDLSPGCVFMRRGAGTQTHTYTVAQAVAAAAASEGQQQLSTRKLADRQRRVSRV